MNNTQTRTKKIILSALMAALTCVATIVIQIPTHTGGYIHLGDGFVLLSGILLGPILGALSAGIGSMLADILTGYVQWAPATFIIKALAALLVGLIYKKIAKKLSLNTYISILLSGIASGLVVVFGYLAYNTLVLGIAFLAAIASIPTDTLQSVAGIAVACLLLPLLEKIPDIKKML